MQLSANQSVAYDRRIEAAGAITMVFGILTALMAAGSVVTCVFAGTYQEALPLGPASRLLLAGTGFVLLGWGTLRRSRLCVVIAAAAASLLLVFQLLWILLDGVSGASLFLQVLPAVVLATNILAWRKMPATASGSPSTQQVGDQ